MQLRGFFVQLLAFILFYQCTSVEAADVSDTRLLRQPSVSKDHIAFVFGGDIWMSDRDGGRAVRITQLYEVPLTGGFLSVPFFRVFTPEGEWHVENEGVAPDVEVPLDPLAVNAGNDVQLDAAIDEVLRQLKSAPQIPLKSAPPMPTHVGN